MFLNLHGIKFSRGSKGKVAFDIKERPTKEIDKLRTNIQKNLKKSEKDFEQILPELAKIMNKLPSDSRARMNILNENLKKVAGTFGIRISDRRFFRGWYLIRR